MSDAVRYSDWSSDVLSSDLLLPASPTVRFSTAAPYCKKRNQGQPPLRRRVGGIRRLQPRPVIGLVVRVIDRNIVVHRAGPHDLYEPPLEVGRAPDREGVGQYG